MVTGSTEAIRFGMILGGVLLALSISSLRKHKRGKSSPLALKGQTGKIIQLKLQFEIQKKNHIYKNHKRVIKITN